MFALTSLALHRDFSVVHIDKHSDRASYPYVSLRQPFSLSLFHASRLRPLHLLHLINNFIDKANIYDEEDGGRKTGLRSTFCIAQRW
jgi:hypothetical protein